jgi:hypothetical protein
MRCTLMVSTPACHHGRGHGAATPRYGGGCTHKMQDAHAPERMHQAFTYNSGRVSSLTYHKVCTRCWAKRSRSRPAPVVLRCACTAR